MIALIITGAVGAYITYKAYQLTRAANNLETVTCQANPEAWNAASTSWKLKWLAVACATAGIFLVLSLHFIFGSILLMLGACAYFTAAADRAGQAGVTSFTANTNGYVSITIDTDEVAA